MVVKWREKGYDDHIAGLLIALTVTTLQDNELVKCLINTRAVMREVK